VATGRLSSSEPNLQNIPADPQGFGIQVRAAFKPAQGYQFISADYSQIELRVLAELSGDIHLRNAFLHGHDIHKETAARLFEIDLDTVSHEQRQLGKRINFSILYGLTPYGLSKDLHIPFADAKKYIAKYFSQYPAVSQWMEHSIAKAKEQGFVTTYYGRRRYIPAIYEKNHTLYQEACRVAINTIAQGTAAEIIKIGMINLQKILSEKAPDATIVLQIHDELLITAPIDQISHVEILTKRELESVVTWNIPLVVTMRHGSDWKDVTK
jgi:DNA polymerase I